MNPAPVSRGENTRAEITNAAHRLFLEGGYHGTSMRQIAQAADVSLSGIYNHFSNKEDVFLAVLIDHHPYVEVLPAILAAQGETVAARLRDAAERMVAVMGKRRDILNLMFIELVEFNGVHLSDLFQIIYPQMMAFAQNLLQDQESLRPIPPPILLRAFIGLLFSYVMTELILGDYMPEEMKTSSLDYFVDIFLYGIVRQ